MSTIALAQSPEIATFKSRNHGYTLQYPKTWHPQILEDVFYIESFPPSKAVRAVRIPEGGAGIKILVPSQVIPKGQPLPTNVEEWATLGSGRRTVISRRSREVGAGPSKVFVIEIKAQCCGTSPDEESVEWYFEIQGRLFLGELFYWPGEVKSTQFEKVLEQIVASLRVAAP